MLVMSNRYPTCIHITVAQIERMLVLMLLLLLLLHLEQS